TTYSNCPLPTPEDRLLFILTYLKTYSLQVVHGRLFGMVQGKANQWIHVLLPILLTTLRTLGDAPARSVADLARRLGLCETDTTALLTAEEEVAPQALVLDPSLADTDRPDAPLLPMTGLSVRSSVPRMRLNRRTIIAARKSATHSRTCC
ncbi:MAG TPA: transposase family protein, partial [Roseiflexaceae bacterium]|nr:transposase family protein [Roseiflexaceae bacterium]